MAFRDSKEQVWDMAITVGSVLRVKRLLDVDLFDVVTAVKNQTPLMGILSTDHALLVNVCYVILKPALDAAAITEDQFAERLSGKGFASMRLTFFEELRRFFTESGRHDQAIAINRLQETESLATTESTRLITEINPEDVVSRAIAAGTASTNGPASAASSPTA